MAPPSPGGAGRRVIGPVPRASTREVPLDAELGPRVELGEHGVAGAERLQAERVLAEVGHGATGGDRDGEPGAGELAEVRSLAAGQGEVVAGEVGQRPQQAPEASLSAFWRWPERTPASLGADAGAGSRQYGPVRTGPGWVVTGRPPWRACRTPVGSAHGSTQQFRHIEEEP